MSAVTETPDQSLITALREQLERDTGAPVELLQTHISWLLLTRTHAYKLKKPVRLPFVDFSTLAARQHFCAEELRLNRRLAPTLYLGLLPVGGTPQAPRLNADGAPIDVVVCMQRFPAGALLSEQLTTATLPLPPLDRFAVRLARFHQDAAVAAATAPFGTAQQVLAAVWAVLQQLQGLAAAGSDDAVRLARLHGWLQAQAAALPALAQTRRAQGAVRECHGDLHAANVVQIDHEWTAFDCLEFDPALRWIDVFSDLAFLTMDLKAHGHPELAWRLLDGYLQQTGDIAGLPLLRFYEVYRALVRALVTRLHRQQPASGAAPPLASPDYLACASALAQTDSGSARLLITHGLSGSGKSTLSQQLLSHAGAIRLRSDVERKRLFGFDALAHTAAHGVDIYTPDATRRTFARLRDLARLALSAGYPVIIDAAFLRRSERQHCRALAEQLAVPFAILHCQASAVQLRQRVSQRQRSGSDASEADVAVLEQQLGGCEELDPAERAVTLCVDTGAGLDLTVLAARWLAAKAGWADAVQVCAPPQR